MQHRLGGKSNLMGEGLSATRVGLDSGPSPWAWPALPVARRSPTNSRKRETERGLAWIGHRLAYLLLPLAVIPLPPLSL